MSDLLINLAASVVTGTAVWLVQRLLRLRRVARRRAFFGLGPGQVCLLSVARHAASPHENSVHRRDVAALIEIGSIVRDCGARAELVADGDVTQGLGRMTEFCVGGPISNARAGAHMRSMLPGVHIEPDDAGGALLTYQVGSSMFPRRAHNEEFVILARVWGPGGGRPVFILGGQTARSNLAAARYLSRAHGDLHRRYGAGRRFCLVLKVVEGAAYGPDFTELVGDLSEEAFTSPIQPRIEPEYPA